MFAHKLSLNESKQNYITRRITAQKHPFHILGPSPYPHLVGFFVTVFLVPLTLHLHDMEVPFLSNVLVMHFGGLGLFFTIMS